jgi:hypothetical protein
MGRAWIAIVAALAGCAATEVSPVTAVATGSADAGPASTSVGLNPGESMTFEVRLGGVLAGEAALAVGELGDFDGKQAVVVKSRANTAGAAALLKRIVDEATTVIDMESGRPLQLDTYVEQGSRTTTAHATFTDKVANVTYQRSDSPKPHTYTINFRNQTVHDTHSAMAQIRGWRAAPGSQRTVFVVGGRRLWRVDVRLAGTETIGTSLGNRRAIKLEGSSFRARPNFEVESGKAARTFTVWLSDDADRVPLRVVAHTELGDVTVELTDYARP